MQAKKQNFGAKSHMGFVEVDPSGRYGRFREALGKGAMKTVYRAFDQVLGMEVAWNQVMLNDVLRSPDELHRLYSEVHLLKNLDHDSIIQFYNSWVDLDQKTFNFITEMLTSGTLREYRQKYKDVDIRAIKNWARQILRGLIDLHSHDPPVIHRDLKCDNIFVNGHLGQVKIGDLGLAAILRGSQHAHSVIGTPEFMAPELYEEDYNELVDVYSFGMCMLEMITLEYPYSECSNPAQIYKKVTSGKKPEAFYRIQDVEAQQFIAKCLASASERPPAHALLLDPFLATNNDAVLSSKMSLQVYSPKSVMVEMPFMLDNPNRSTDMTITGKVNPEDNTLYLKVQISDKDGHVRNIHFPFDVVKDTAMNVAQEMVKELDINDWEPHEIAEMIEEEISALAPGWEDSGSLDSPQQHSFDCNEDDDENHELFLSSCSPSHDSLHGISGICEIHSSREHAPNRNTDWFQGSVCSEDVSSERSHSLYNYSEMEYCSAKDDCHSSTSREEERLSDVKSEGYSGFSPQQKLILKCNGQNSPQKGKTSSGYKKLCKMRSFMDIRSQLLHRSLMQALGRRDTAKTVGAVENIGFQNPC